ncbi:MAG: transposase, partial [Cyanobacteria bacterium J06641_2]
ALATILQYIEGLTDRQTADSVRTRIDWKYLLCLELTDSGFHHTVLSEFRTRLIAGEAEALILDKLLKLCQEKGWLKSRMRQRTDSTHVLGAIRAITRLECAGETLRAALNTLAVVAPGWLLSNADEEWVKRYSTRIEDHHQPKSKSKREQLAYIYGEDGLKLLNAIFAPSSPDWLRKIPAVEILCRVWVQQYYLSDNTIRWRTSKEIPPASVMISSPYDLDAHYAKKQTTTWVGYKVHLTETCESNQPHLITHVETTSAPITDDQATPAIHESLKSQDLLPSQHIVDTGYLDAELLAITEQQYGVELIGPTRNDYHWQSREGKGFAAANFSVNWKEQSVTCPEGKTSSSWSSAVDKWGNKVVKIKFASSDCAVCPSLN